MSYGINWSVLLTGLHTIRHAWDDEMWNVVEGYMNSVVDTKPIAVSITRAASLVGLSKWTIRAYARSGKLPVARFGKRVLIPMSALERFVKDATVNGEEREQ
jgi:excisionase family DNA binding protein